MRRTSLSLILALAVVAGACGDDSPRVAKVDEMRVVKVSGDQSSPVASTAPSATIYATAGASLQTSPGDGWTDEPLVARVEVTGSGGAGMMGPNSATVPSGTLVHWQLPDEAGRLFGGTTATDDSAHVVNRWAPGTRAGTYTAQAGRMVGTEIVIDAEWELVVEPGELASVDVVQFRGGEEPRVSTGDTIDGRSLVASGRDKHANLITAERIGAMPDSLVSWTWSDAAYGSDAPPVHSSGWAFAVPALEGWREIDHATGERLYSARLHLTINGVRSSEWIPMYIRAD